MWYRSEQSPLLSFVLFSFFRHAPFLFPVSRKLCLPLYAHYSICSLIFCALGISSKSWSSLDSCHCAPFLPFWSTSSMPRVQDKLSLCCQLSPRLLPTTSRFAALSIFAMLISISSVLSFNGAIIPRKQEWQRMGKNPIYRHAGSCTWVIAPSNFPGLERGEKNPKTDFRTWLFRFLRGYRLHLHFCPRIGISSLPLIDSHAAFDEILMLCLRSPFLPLFLLLPFVVRAISLVLFF